jgi:hypothetical protein
VRQGDPDGELTDKIRSIPRVPVRLPGMERTVALRSVVDNVGDFEVPGDGGGVDEERRDETIQMVGMVRSIVSWHGGTARLEAARAAGASGGGHR